MLSYTIFDQLDRVETSEIVNEFYSSIALIDYYKKELKFIDHNYYLEADDATSEEGGEKKEGFLAGIKNGIMKAFSAIANFFKKLFGKNKDIGGNIQEAGQAVLEAKKLGMTAEQIVDQATNPQPNPQGGGQSTPAPAPAPVPVPPDKKDELVAFLNEWMNSGNMPDVLPDAAKNEVKQLIAAFDSLLQLLNGEANTLATQGTNIMQSIDNHAKALCQALQQAGAQQQPQQQGTPQPQPQPKQTTTEYATRRSSSRVILEFDGTPKSSDHGETTKLLEAFSNKLDEVQKAVALIMQDEAKSKALENIGNISGALKDAMDAGRIISGKVQVQKTAVLAIRAALKKGNTSTVVAINSSKVGKAIGGKAYSNNSKFGKGEKSHAQDAYESTYQELIDKGMDEATAQKYANIARDDAAKKYEEKVVDTNEHLRDVKNSSKFKQTQKAYKTMKKEARKPKKKNPKQDVDEDDEET